MPLDDLLRARTAPSREWPQLGDLDPVARDVTGLPRASAVSMTAAELFRNSR